MASDLGCPALMLFQQSTRVPWVYPECTALPVPPAPFLLLPMQRACHAVGNSELLTDQKVSAPSSSTTRTLPHCNCRCTRFDPFSCCWKKMLDSGSCDGLTGKNSTLKLADQRLQCLALSEHVQNPPVRDRHRRRNLLFQCVKPALHLSKWHGSAVWLLFFCKVKADTLPLPLSGTGLIPAAQGSILHALPSHKLWSSAKTSFVDHHLVSFFRFPPYMQL